MSENKRWKHTKVKLAEKAIAKCIKLIVFEKLVGKHNQAKNDGQNTGLWVMSFFKQRTATQRIEKWTWTWTKNEPAIVKLQQKVMKESRCSILCMSA